MQFIGNATSANQASGHSLTAVYVNAMIMRRSVIRRQVRVLNVAISLMAIIVIVARLGFCFVFAFSYVFLAFFPYVSDFACAAGFFKNSYVQIPASKNNQAVINW